MQRRNSRGKNDELLHDRGAEDKTFLESSSAAGRQNSISHRDHFSSKSCPSSEILSEEPHCFPLERNRGVHEHQTSKLGT